MLRTQIYLTQQENRALSLLARLEGQTKSEIIRKFLDEKLGLLSPGTAPQAAKKALGAWKGKVSKKYLSELRKHW